MLISMFYKSVIVWPAEMNCIHSGHPSGISHAAARVLGFGVTATYLAFRAQDIWVSGHHLQLYLDNVSSSPQRSLTLLRLLTLASFRFIWICTEESHNPECES